MTEKHEDPDLNDNVELDPKDLKIQELEKFKNDYLYLRAEFDNYKKQMIKERSDLLKYGGERLAYDLLNILDIFEKALSTELTAQTMSSFKSGLEMTSSELKKTLERHGIQEISSLGQKFDPTYHEALSQIPSKDHSEPTVLEVFKKGYKYHDKTLRHTQVVVSKETPKEKPKDT
jgi:molecular chaperone GrpE